MVLEKLSDSLKKTLEKIARSSVVDEKLINELIKDIQKAMLQSDVNVKLVFDLTKEIKERALKEKPPGGMTNKEYLVKIVYEEMVKFLGGKGSKVTVDAKKKPFKIMLVGLFGSGKTTIAGKLGKFFTKRGYKVGLLGLDVHRPAAPDQLEQVAKGANVPAMVNKKEKNAMKIIAEYEKEFSKYDILIIDTAGRDALSDDLIDEINAIYKKLQPDENLLVISADIGQAAERQARVFHEACKVTGIAITKLEGTAKGGGSLIACSVTGAPVKFIGIGEKVDDLEEFDPERFVGRMLGMGDIQTLLEKAREAITEEEAQDLGKKLLKGEFNLMDLYSQMEAMKKMGPLSKVVDMIPGFGNVKIPKDMLQGQEEKLKKWKHIMNSMTREELEDPEVIAASRVDRIAKGSGTSTSEVRELIKQYRQSKKMMKMMKGQGGMERMMRKMGGRMPKGM